MIDICLFYTFFIFPVVLLLRVFKVITISYWIVFAPILILVIATTNLILLLLLLEIA